MIIKLNKYLSPHKKTKITISLETQCDKNKVLQIGNEINNLSNPAPPNEPTILTPREPILYSIISFKVFCCC